MELQDLAKPIDYLGQEQFVIEDDPLLQWAKERGLAHHQAQIEALEQRIIPHRYLKNLWSLGFDEQAKLCAGRIFICGCGGLGGIQIELLARAGVGRMRLMDMDTFTESNLNRQLLCHTAQIPRQKALVAAERIETVNPLVEVESFGEFLRPENVEGLIGGMDLVLDALDNIEARRILATAARKLGIPFIHAGVAGWWGQISTFLPESEHDLSSIYGNRLTRDGTEDAAGVLGPTPAVIGSLSALEAIRILVGKKPAYSGQLLYFDGENGVFQIVPL
jgi:molybdopterin-synthase adenylyltransferase